MSSIVYLQLYMERCRVEASINDIVVFRKNENNITSLAQPIHEYLVNGENSLTLKAYPFDADFLTPPTNAHLRAASFKEGEFLEFSGGNSFADIFLSPQQSNVIKPQASFEETMTFNYLTDKSWEWEQAPIIKLDEAGLKQINQFVTEAHQAFKQKQADKIAALSSNYYKELAACYPIEGYDDRVQSLKEYIADPEIPWKAVELDLESTDYRLAAGGKLVECIAKDGLPLLRTETDDVNAPHNTESYVAVPMHIGLSNNNFVVYR